MSTTLTSAQYHTIESFHDDVEALLDQLEKIAQEPPTEIGADVSEAVAAFREKHPCDDHVSIFAMINPTP